MGDNAKPGQSLELSKSQELLLAGQQLQPRDPLYNMAFSFRLRGTVDVTAFDRAFQALAGLCDSLRLVIRHTSSGSVQDDTGSAAGEHLFVDLSTCKQPEHELHAWIAAHCARDFDLGQCQFESALLKLGQQDYVWYFNQHHLFTDAWSVSLIFDKLAQLYQLQCAAAQGDCAALPGVTAAVRNQQPETSTMSQRAVDYWRDKQKLSGRMGRFYRDLPRNTGGRTRRHRVELDAERSRLLESLIGTPGFSSFSRELSCMQVFATVLFAYLHRVSGRETLAIGTPSHSRSTPELRASVGLLINIFPLYVHLEKATSFTGLHALVARANQELLMHAEPGVASALDSRAFDVVLNFIPSTFAEFAGIPVDTDWVHPGYGDSNHLLRLQVHDFDRKGQFTLLFDLNEEAFSEEESQWVSGHFLALFDALLANPEQDFTALPLADVGEQLSCSRGDDPWPRVREIKNTVVERLESQFVAAPERVALSCRGHEWSYSDLDRRSAALAACLAARGAGPGKVVGMLLQRSPDLVAAAIAVLRSGAILLPLDTSYPAERNAFMLRDSAAILLISCQESLGALQCSGQEPVLLDRDWPDIEAQPQPTPLQSASCEDGAYIIYTSGSTGQPKGVLVGHGAFSNYIGWAADHYLQGDAADFPLFTPVCFDLTMTSLFTPLVCRGKMVIYPEPKDGSEITIRKVIEDNAVDVIKLTPAHLALIRNMDLSRSRLRCLIVGGDDLKVDIAATISDYLGGAVAIFNEYGPTEATVGCTLHRFDPAHDTKSSVPIGRPISNTRIYVLDQHLNPVPRGVTGELYIAGAGLAQGYLHQPALTAERFLPDPFEDGQRMYRSGDLARWSHRGYLEYLGRSDHQVKVRGVRIETAEVEATLLALPEVADAVVDVMIPESPSPDDSLQRCERCGIEGRHPAAQLGDSGLCRICRVYEQNQAQAQAYYRTLDDLSERIASIRAAATGKPDCIMLLSGGKDSSYALCRLVDLGLTPLVFTLDNGYISEGAMDNIRALVDRLGLELVIGSTPAMDSIFVESLTRHSNVCNGCFKTIYTLSMKLARERGISTICTGLSRGQLFETRVAHLFQQGIYDAAEIDNQIIEARKAYHRVDDVIARSLDVSIFEQDSIFEEIDFLDFYRYTEVSLDEIYDYLHSRVAWSRPKDTGRSTNCLINDAGIYVHKMERGYHNYALPYSWDVRLGHKQRDAAIDELEDEIDDTKVNRILGDIGYVPRKAVASSGDNTDKQLIAYYVADEEFPSQLLRDQLGRQLPAEFIPRQFVRLSQIPLTENGKVDRSALPRPQLTRQILAGSYAAPRTQTERILVALWQRMLALDEVGIDDDFFALGGDSIINVQIVASAREQGVDITPQQLFDHPSVRELAAVAGQCNPKQVDQSPVIGEVPLLPALQRYFNTGPAQPAQFCQAVVLHCRHLLDTRVLQEALQELVTHHDALRSRFECSQGKWQQLLFAPGELNPGVTLIDTTGATATQREATIDQELAQMEQRMDLASGRLLHASCLQGEGDNSATLLIAINHLVVDGVSWWALLEDLEKAYKQVTAGAAVVLPGKTTSVAEWGRQLELIRRDADDSASAFWSGAAAAAGSIPHEPALISDNTAASAERLDMVLDRETTTSLARVVPATFGVQVQDLLLTALGQAVLSWSDEASVTVEMEGYGRKDPRGELNPVRTVGWFTSFYPLTLQLSDSGGLGDDLRATRQQLQSIPFGGIEYGIHHYLAGDAGTPAAEAGDGQAPLLFNYMGQWDLRLSDDSLFSFARPITVLGNKTGQRQHLLELNTMIFDGCLHMEWQFSRNLHKAEEIRHLAEDYCQRIRQLITYATSSGDSGLTPADFPTAGIDQEELDSLMEEFGELP